MMNVDWGHSRGAVRPASALACVPPDPVFPQLQTFQDEHLARTRLCAAFGVQTEVESCEIFNVWYIPRKSFQVVYRLHGPQRAGHMAMFGVRFVPRLSVSEPRRAHHNMAYMPDWGALAWQFPDDPELTALPRLVRSADGLQVLSYLPGARCTIRGQVREFDQSVIGKLDRAGGADRTHQTLCRLWRAGAARFRIPRPLAADPEAGIRWEQAVDGQRVDRFLGQQSTTALLQPVVAAAADLHATDVAGLPEVSARDLVLRIQHKVLPRVAAALPDLAGAAEAWFAVLARQAAQLPQRPPSTLHGDLHTANVLVDEHGVIFVDLDSLAQGDAALDLALLGSRVLLLALQRGQQPADAAEAVAELPDVYATVGGVPIPHSTFAWYLSALLVGRQLRTAIRHRAPDLGALAPVLLSWAREILDRGHFTPAICDELITHNHHHEIKETRP
jgi:hypothetical protein